MSFQSLVRAQCLYHVTQAEDEEIEEVAFNRSFALSDSTTPWRTTPRT